MNPHSGSHFLKQYLLHIQIRGGDIQAWFPNANEAHISKLSLKLRPSNKTIHHVRMDSNTETYVYARDCVPLAARDGEHVIVQNEVHCSYDVRTVGLHPSSLQSLHGFLLMEPASHVKK